MIFPNNIDLMSCCAHSSKSCYTIRTNLCNFSFTCRRVSYCGTRLKRFATLNAECTRINSEIIHAKHVHLYALTMHLILLEIKCTMLAHDHKFAYSYNASLSCRCNVRLLATEDCLKLKLWLWIRRKRSSRCICVCIVCMCVCVWGILLY